MENANETLFREALTHFPGGVSSPVRAFKAVGGTPKFFRKAWGARFEDEEGRRYVDLCMSWGPLILGHAVPEVLAAAMVDGSFTMPALTAMFPAPVPVKNVPPALPLRS